jgi:outer membrane murein-binding lipoprotein Lpp
MDKQEFFNNKYQNLCSQLGDSIVKLDQLSEHISNLKAQIAELNKAFNHVAEYEALKSAKASANLKEAKND